LHSIAKHIEIKDHFIRDYVQKGVLDIQFMCGIKTKEASN